jgi:hypothetical protein
MTPRVRHTLKAVRLGCGHTVYRARPDIHPYYSCPYPRHQQSRVLSWSDTGRYTDGQQCLPGPLLPF